MRSKKLFLELAAAAALAASVLSCGRNEIKPVKNIILMIPDGTSTSLLSVVRWYREYTSPDNGNAALALDPYICGLVREQNSDSPIAESSAAMTAYMTGQFVQGPNICVYPASHPGQDIIRVNPDSAYQPLATVMEGAKILKDKALGVVVTVRANHATPAGTASHSVSRNDGRAIIRQMASNRLDVVFGGGIKYMDDDVKAILADNSIDYIEKDIEAFRAYQGERVWSLFSDGEMAYDIDRNPEQEPSLEEMTSKAIELLSRNKNGFFLMVEGSKVDYSAHSNDAGGLISEFDAFDRAVKVALDYAREQGNTAVIIAPDHGTSGVSIGGRNYYNYTEKGLDSALVNLRGFKATAPAIEERVRKASVADVPKVFKECTGLDLRPDELAALVKAKDQIETNYMNINYSYNLQAEVARIMAAHTHIGYVSGGHTSEDVFLAVYNPYGQRPEGHIKATELAGYMARLAGLPVSLQELTSSIYVRHDVLLDGHQFEVSGEKDKAVLSIDGGKVRVPANRSYIYVNEEKQPVASLSVFVPQNGNFYISREILNYL